jgi:hypothetical protein
MQTPWPDTSQQATLPLEQPLPARKAQLGYPLQAAWRGATTPGESRDAREKTPASTDNLSSFFTEHLL